jgi:GNAT superfamily N-acetyltransferase
VSENRAEDPIATRRLGRGDERLVQEICRRFKDRVPSDAEAARLLARDDVHVWVAEAHGEPVGFAYAYVLLRIDGDVGVFLYELSVDERFRRRGTGRALVEEARTLARRVGALKMWVDTSPDNEPAQRTYSAAGGTPSRDLTVLFEWRFR